MPKLRHGTTDTEKFTQWLGRKCRNHNPLAELNMSGRESLPSRYKTQKTGTVRVMDTEERNVLLYHAGNRVFAIKVTEVDPETYLNADTVAVGT